MGAVTGKAWLDHSEPRIMAADLEAIEAAAASTIVGEGRPDIPATLTTPGTAALVAAATSGTAFRSVDGPQGAWEWQKRGSTWVVTDGDTGLIDCSAWLSGGWTGTLQVGRRNSEIRWYLDGLDGSAASTAFLISAVSNRRLWEPELLTRPLFHAAVAPTTVYRANLALEGQLSLPAALPLSTPLYSSWAHRTTLPWPLTLTP